MDSLRGLRSNSRYDLNEIAENIASVDQWERKVQLIRRSCLSLHNIACVDWLADLDANGFKSNLISAGRQWKTLLEEAKGNSHRIPSFYNKALLGLLAVNELGLAQQVVELSAVEISSLEYEDEFYYALLLQQMVSHSVADGTAALEQTLAQLRAALSGMSATRADVCEALLNQDFELFVAGMGDLNVQFEEEMVSMASNMSVPPQNYMAAKHIWLEGMALLTLAARFGMQINEPFKYIPTGLMQKKGS